MIPLLATALISIRGFRDVFHSRVRGTEPLSLLRSESDDRLSVALFANLREKRAYGARAICLVGVNLFFKVIPLCFKSYLRRRSLLRAAKYLAPNQ